MKLRLAFAIVGVFLLLGTAQADTWLQSTVDAWRAGEISGLEINPYSGGVTLERETVVLDDFSDTAKYKGQSGVGYAVVRDAVDAPGGGPALELTCDLTATGQTIELAYDRGLAAKPFDLSKHESTVRLWVYVDNPSVIDPDGCMMEIGTDSANSTSWKGFNEFRRPGWQLVERRLGAQKKGLTDYRRINHFRFVFKTRPDDAETGQPLKIYLSGLHVREVTALIDNAGRDVDINAAVSIRFDKGAFGSLSFNGNALHHDEGLTFHGDKGCIVIHQHSWRIRSILHNNEPLTAPKSIAPSTPDDAFFRWIRGAKGYERPAYALEVARISEAVYKSVATGKVVRVAG